MSTIADFNQYHELIGDILRNGSIVIHCHEFDRTVTFWQNAPHYIPRKPAKDGGSFARSGRKRAELIVPTAGGTERRRSRRNWMHLGLYTNQQEEEVNRLRQLGAHRYPWRYRPDSDFVVLEDPDGNLFCVVQLP